jgi:hypothetical protein
MPRGFNSSSNTTWHNAFGLFRCDGWGVGGTGTYDLHTYRDRAQPEATKLSVDYGLNFQYAGPAITLC